MSLGAILAQAKREKASADGNAIVGGSATERNDKMANKLLNNIDILSCFSSKLKDRFQQQELEIQEKQKRQSQRQSESNKLLESKIVLLSSLQQSLKVDLNMKSSQLKEAQVNAQKQKEDLFSLKNLKQEMVKNLKLSSKQELQMKQQSIKQLQDEIEKIKEEIKIIRKARRDIEDRNFELEEIKVRLSLKLNELGDKQGDKDKLKQAKMKELQALEQEQLNLAQKLQDRNSEKDRNSQHLDDLKNRLSQLNKKRDDLQKDIDKAPRNMEELEAKLDKLTNEIMKLEDDLKNKKTDLAELKSQVASIQKIIQELVEFQLLIKKLLSFERLSRQVQMKFHTVELKQRKLDYNIKDLSKNLKLFVADSGINQDTFSSQIMSTFNDLQQDIQIRNDIRDDLKIINSKILGKNLNELKSDQVQINLEKMETYTDKLDALLKNFDEQDLAYTGSQNTFLEIKNKIKQDFYAQSQQLNDNIREIIADIQKTQRLQVSEAEIIEKKADQMPLLNDHQMAFYEKFSVKISQFNIHQKSISSQVKQELSKQDIFSNQSNKLQKGMNEQVISNYVVLNQHLSDQCERVKLLKGSQLGDLNDKLQELKDYLEQYEQLMQKDKVNEAKHVLQEGEQELNDIDKLIDELQSRMNDVDKELARLDGVDDDMIKHELTKQLEKLQKQLDNQKQSKEDLTAQLEKLRSLPDDSLLHQRTDDVRDALQAIHQKALPLVDEDLYDLEGKLKRALNRKRNQLKKECQDSLDTNNQMLDKLQEYLEKIDQRIKQLEKEGGALYTIVNYADMEREQEVDEKVKQELKSQRQQYMQLKERREGLTKSIQELEKNIELQAGASNTGDKDEIAQQWRRYIQESEKIGMEINEEVGRAQRQVESLDILGQVIGELAEKYRYKDQKYKEAQDNQYQKQQAIDQIKTQMLKLGKEFYLIQENLGQIIDCPDICVEFQERQRQAQQLKDKIETGKQRQQDLQAKLNTICQDLPHMKSKMLLTRDLQQVLDDLNRLNIDFQYEGEDLKNLQEEYQELLNGSKNLVEENKRIKVKEAEKELGELGVHVQEMDKKYKETNDKLQEYYSKLHQGLKDTIGDEDAQTDLKKWRQEAEELERELKQLDATRGKIKGQEKLMRDQIYSLKLNLGKATAKDIDFIAQNSKKLNREATDVIKDLQRIYDELEERHYSIDNYLSKQNELAHLYTEFEQVLSDSEKNLHNLQKRLDEICDLSDLLKQVLLEMELGIPTGDYKLKEGFIKTELEDLQDVEDQLFKLDELKQSIAVQIQIFKSDKDKNKGIQADSDALQLVIGEAMEQLEKLEATDKQSLTLLKRLNQIRVEVGIADIPELIQIREKEVTEFSGKLRKLEGDFIELKKQINTSSGSPSKDIQQDVSKIDQHIKLFRDDKVSFQRILGQDLQQFLPQPQRLENLGLLKEVIFKVRDLGEKVNKQLDTIDKMLSMNMKLRRKVGGMDMMKRVNEVNMKENDQRTRLERVKARFDIIGKGASDCDGYTSNTEEATFIDTLLGEIPEMKQKQRDSMDECDQIANIVYELKRDIEKQANVEGDERSHLIVETLESVEEQTDLNEKTVAFLEKLADKLEDHFLSMDVKRKLDKRQLELAELKNIGEDFADKLLDMQQHLISDVEKIQEKTKIQNPLQELLVDEDGNPVNLLEELMVVNNELRDILSNVTDLQVRNDDIRAKRNEAQEDFNEKILRNSPYKTLGSRITNKQDVFTLLRANGQIKKNIIELIKQLKDISKRLRDSKSRYQILRNKLERQQPRKLYKAVKGDIVDELFAEYINKLNCPVPIKRLGNNYYTFGTKKIFAKIINGKLVIRVGGGYMGIEEFMMYYGHQELQKLQKEEQMRLTDSDLSDPVAMSGSAILGDDFMTDDDSDNGTYHRKSNAANVDIEQLKEKLKTDSESKRRLQRNSSAGGRSGLLQSEEQKDAKAVSVVGIGDVRRALKNNLATIHTYEETKTGTRKGVMSINSENTKVEKELRKIEARVGNKLKQNLEAKRSPGRANESGTGKSKDSQSGLDAKKLLQSRIPGLKK